MFRFIRLLAVLSLISSGIVLAQGQPLSSDEILMFTGCVRSRSWNMLGSKEFATGDPVSIKYLFTRKGAPDKKRSLYMAFVDKRGDFGRLFLVQKFEDGWWVINDANFETKPKWKLTSEPLGGGNVAGRMDEALADMQERPPAQIRKLPPLAKKPQGCSTYIQK